jgi:hypothetical protein
MVNLGGLDGGALDIAGETVPDLPLVHADSLLFRLGES